MRLVPAVLLLATLPQVAAADILRFRDGGELEAPAREDGADVIVVTPMGERRFPRSDVREIVPSESIESQWRTRRAEASAAGGEAPIDAAFWGFAHGLAPEAEALAREAHARAPGARSTALVACLDRLGGERPDPDLGPLLRSLPRGMKLARGPHVLLLHQHSDAEAAERVDVLERVIAAFYVEFHALGFDLPAPQRRLSSAWMARKEDYLAALREEGASAFLSTRGYYHSPRRLVLAYDCRDDPERRRARESIAERRAAPDASPALVRALDRRELLLEFARREIDFGIAAHETIHQLVEASGLAPAHDRFPDWLHEGLAMQFEAVKAGRWAGPACPSPYRLADFRALPAFPSFEAAMIDPSSARGYGRDRYARAWGAVLYLRRSRPAVLVRILDGLRLETGREAATALPLQSLRDACGDDLPQEAEAWKRCMELLPDSRPTQDLPGQPH